MKILISAAETSSDAHGAQLLRALKDLSPGIEAFGIGGPKLQGEGLRVVVDARELLSMGFVEILARLPKILRALARISAESARERPQIAVVIDYPDFHFRLAKRLRRLGIPIVYYIPPKVWVWRKNRLKILRERFAAILSILPFEVPFYRDAGVPVKYVGNPLLDELPLRMTREEARSRLLIEPARKVLALMPGSRPSELKHHTILFLEAARETARKMRERGSLGAKEALLALVPLPATADFERIRAEIELWDQRSSGGGIEIRVSQANSSECLVAADAGLIKSGTATLEAGVLGCPHAVVYRPNHVSTWIFDHVVRYRGPVGLVNLVADGFEPRPEYLMKEILCENATVENLAEEAVALLTDSDRRAKIARGVERLRKTVITGEFGESPSRMAAQEVLRLARGEAK